MSGRGNPLTVLKGGIDRLRPKGGARADSLYDLVNAQITKEYQVQPRPGTARFAELPEGTVGLTAFGGEFHVFASQPLSVAAIVAFTTPGPDTWLVPDGVTSVDVFLVGGGGEGGGLNENGGGGGAGETPLFEGYAVTPGATINLVVGLGGQDGDPGTSTTFDDGALVALPGGQGGIDGGGDGGSGAAGGGGAGGAAPGVGGEGTQTFNGGDGFLDGGGGGGGGAVAPGENGTADTGGNGGAGVDMSAMFGTTYGVNGVFGGGGGGGHPDPGRSLGGLGGGGQGAGDGEDGEDAIDNTGGGGGGGVADDRQGHGGSGIVLIRYFA